MTCNTVLFDVIWVCDILCHIMSCYIMLCDVVFLISWIMLYHVISSYVMFYHVISWYVMFFKPCDAASCYMISYHVSSYHVISCHILWYLVIWCCMLVCYVISYHMILYKCVWWYIIFSTDATSFYIKVHLALLFMLYKICPPKPTGIYSLFMLYDSVMKYPFCRHRVRCWNQRCSSASWCRGCGVTVWNRWGNGGAKFVNGLIVNKKIYL